MLQKTITLKFHSIALDPMAPDHHWTTTETIVADNEKDAQIKIERLMKEKGAYGFSTQSSVVFPAI